MNMIVQLDASSTNTVCLFNEKINFECTIASVKTSERGRDMAFNTQSPKMKERRSLEGGSLQQGLAQRTQNILIVCHSELF